MFDELCEMLCEEIHKIQQKENITAGDLETLYKLTATIKNLDRIDEVRDGGYSSAARNGNHYVRGHYSRSSVPSGSRYSRSGNMMRELEALYDSARTERERDAIRRCMEMV